MKSKIARWLLKIWGWHVEFEEWPLPDKYVLIAIPHTSGWDFPVGILISRAYKLDIKYVGKKSLFRPPFGALFRWLGGYPVDRSKRTRFVDSVIDIFNEKEKFSICIAPEGTRKRVDKLKTGFYFIAKGANIPVILCKFDWANKMVGISKPFWPTDDQEADFRLIDDFFAGVAGRKPEWGYRYEADK